MILKMLTTNCIVCTFHVSTKSYNHFSPGMGMSLSCIFYKDGHSPQSVVKGSKKGKVCTLSELTSHTHKLLWPS